MDYLDLKFALARKGYTLTRVAMELGLFGPQSVQQVLTRKYFSARVEKRVSEITGISLEKLFPDRYAPTKHRTRGNGGDALDDHTTNDAPRKPSHPGSHKKNAQHAGKGEKSWPSHSASLTRSKYAN
jgi:lambda repressor-like predicted transcriptional regulator